MLSTKVFTVNTMVEVKSVLD